MGGVREAFRKVELGSCGRPYATPCTHEHACIRCPTLHVNPKMIRHLTDVDIDNDLIARRERADAEGGQGEIEGIDLTLTCLRAERDEVHRRLRRTTDLGLPKKFISTDPEEPLSGFLTRLSV